ncbi:hypothetical protein FA95DRAFT_1499284, partial [Auriscalpium vulgare]
APFDDADADATLRSSDNITFAIHMAFLAKASPVFRSKFAMLPQSSDSQPEWELPYPARTLEFILRMCYPFPDPEPASLGGIEGLISALRAAEQYGLVRARSFAGYAFATSADVAEHPAKAFGLACAAELEPEARHAALLSLRKPMSLEALDEDLPFLRGYELHHLWTYRKRCRDLATSLVADLSWVGRALFDWAQEPSCSCPRSPIAIAGGDTHYAQCWWTGYLQEAMRVLQARPWGEGVRISSVNMSRLLGASYELAARCDECRSIAIDALTTFGNALAGELERRISAVSLHVRSEPSKFLPPTG